MMRWTGDLKIALNNLKATKVRTALTILGIIIGVASVTAVLALGEGAKNAVRGQALKLGDNILTVRPGKAKRDDVGNVLNYNYLAALSVSTLTELDLQTISQTEGVTSAAPFMLVTGSIKTQDKTSGDSTIIATTPQAQQVMDLRLSSGEFIKDDANRNNVILGQDLAIELLGSDVAIGHKVELRGTEFTVAGILKRFDSSASVSNVFDLNRAAFIHLAAGKNFNQGAVQMQQINVRTNDSQVVNQVATDLQQKILANHNGEEDFAVLRPVDAVQITDDLFHILTSLISAVASISILVGGVGIMNIMLVSVTERTREIGIRKAVGATNRQILYQFLVEALVMTAVGGILGIIVGYCIAFLAGTFLGFMPGITVLIPIIALAISIVVGLIFGAWPALKAARKDPIEALRYFQ